VSHSKRHQHDSEPDQPLELLTSLGFGPDTVLMNDPKLFVDGRFLASLLVELYDELPDRQASLALFQIGLLHGLRDAARVCSGDDLPRHAMEGTVQRRRRRTLSRTGELARAT
jgi:hypothetical protein